MRKPLIGALALGAALPLIAAAPAEAAPAVRFSLVQYDAKGKDTGKNVNGEYLVITNYGSKAVSLAGWTIGHTRQLKDSKYTFYFPARNFSVKPKGKIVMRMGEGRKTKTTVYQGMRRHLWPNVKGAAYLFDRSNKRIDACAWNSPTGSTRC
ncbi:lamin tail domain-containing protein [Actinocorallia sp. B10E7]|uniref:lamin tail domain-containing protein n=1 Tax=Actinocorallia sp. B10E7 TaxID=3153558 RepID=UPI00325EBB8C